jgi:hypothetical protein
LAAGKKAVVVGSKRQLDFRHFPMPPRRRQQPKNQQCQSCFKWYTASGIGKHVQNCAKWDLVDVAQPDLTLLHHSASSDDNEMTSEISLSSDSNDSCHGSDADELPAPHIPTQSTILDDGWDNPDMEVDPESNEATQYQGERVEIDDEDDEDWWNMFVVPDPEEAVEEVEDDVQEFEELLHWIDNDMDLEVARNSKPSTAYKSHTDHPSRSFNRRRQEKYQDVCNKISS